MNISATDLTQETATILNTVYYQKTPVTIYRHGKPLAKLIPIEKEKTLENNKEETLKSYFGILENFPPVKSARFFRKKNLKLE